MGPERDARLVRTVQVLFETGTTGGMADQQLLDRFLALRDGSAFEALVVRHGSMVLDVCRRILHDPHDAEDAFQATFLILARRARAIRKRESLASWLFGVARRVACRSRAREARRRPHERSASGRPAAVDDRGPARDDAAVLHEEIGRLPEKYREPVVLCYLEAMTHEAAAEKLCCPVGTVSVRLMRAKQRLKSRLSRRGLMVPGGLPAGWASPGVAVPPTLAETAVRSALAFEAGRGPVAGLVSAPVLSLTHGVLKSMFLAKMKLVLVLAGSLVLAGVGGRALLGQPGPSGKDRTEPPAVKAKPATAATEDPEPALRRHLVEVARRRRDVQRQYYEEGRITISRFIDALAQFKDAEVQAATNRQEKLDTVAAYLDEVKKVEKRERDELGAGRGTTADVEEASHLRERAELELYQSRKSSSGHLDLESLDRRISSLERKLDLILKSLQTSRRP